MSWYRTGTINLTNGSKNVTGTGTLFVSNVKSGFALLAPDFSVYEVDNVSSDTSFTIKENYRGTTVSNGTYGIFQTQGIIKDLTDEVTALINTFGAFRDAYNNGDLVGQGLELKGVLNSPSELPASPQQGDTYLVGTYLYVYAGLVSGWRSSNIAGIIPKGVWNSSTAYSVNDTVTYSGSQYRRKVAGTTSTDPSSDTTNWELFVSIGNTGPAGITPQGAWNSATTYTVNDTVQYNGSQYRRIVAGTTSTDPSTDTTNWELFVSKGLDGLGSVVKVNNVSPDINGNVTLTTDNVTEGSTNLWHTSARVRGTTLTGLATSNTAVASSDTLLVGVGKLQGQINNILNTPTATFGHMGLTGFNDSTTPNSKFTVSSAATTYRNASGTSLSLYTSLTQTVDISVSGPAINGRDQSAAFSSSSKVNIYKIFNGTTEALIASLASPASGPALPSGYTYWSYVCTVVLDSSSNLRQMYLVGNTMYFDTQISIMSGSGSAGPTQVSFSAYVPTIALQAIIDSYGLVTTTTATTAVHFVRLSASGGNWKVDQVTAENAGTGYSSYSNTLIVPNLSSQSIYNGWVNNAAVASVASNMAVLGFTIPNGAL